MTFDLNHSGRVAATPTDDARLASRSPSQGLTREQFEAAMRVMDARSMARRTKSPPDESELRRLRR
jgi:hypothetical protein